MEVGGEFVGDVSKESSAGQRYHSQGQSAIYPSDSQHCRFCINSSVLAPSEDDQFYKPRTRWQMPRVFGKSSSVLAPFEDDRFYKPRTRWQMPRCHAFGVLLTICFIGSVRAQCGVPSVSVECSAGRWLDISTGNPFQCMKCTPISCRLQSSPTGGDTISHGTLSVVPTSGRLDNVDKDGSDHVVFGAMVY